MRPARRGKAKPVEGRTFVLDLKKLDRFLKNLCPNCNGRGYVEGPIVGGLRMPNDGGRGPHRVRAECPKCKGKRTFVPRRKPR